MKICHITTVHPRHDIRICEKECVSLVNAGYDVYLVVNDTEEDESYKGIHIVSTKSVDSGRVGRIINAPKRVLRKALEIDAEIYHLHDPELLTISDKLLKSGKKVIFDAHEDTERQIESKDWIPRFIRGIVSSSFGLYSHGKYSRMTGIISVTPSIVEKLRKYNTVVSLITNYPIITDEDYSNNLMMTTEKKVPQYDYVFFAGGITKQWSHNNIIAAVKKTRDISYLFAGRGEANYINQIKTGGVQAKYLGILSHDEVKIYYRNALAGMALLKSNTQVGKDGTLGNTKLFEIMEAGKPVICSDLKLWREIVEKYNCGIYVDSEDVNAIANAVKYLCSHPEEALTMGQNGRKAVEEEFNWKTQEAKLCAFYNKVLGQ